MALGILDGKPFDSPIHEGILLFVNGRPRDRDAARCPSSQF
jgi:hypothetical protein